MTGGMKVAIILMAMLVFFANGSMASDADHVTVVHDASGWKLQVNGDGFFVKGVVWAYIPRNKDVSYDLWNQPEKLVQKVVDHELSLMQQAGINAIRTFSLVPPKWVEYIDRQFSIKTVINPMVGRYGHTLDGKWILHTDYSDPLTRESLKAQTLDVIRKYRNVPGVLMFALGNEGNYGLSWSSFEIENIPEGEQQAAKAEYLYSLLAEIIAEGQKIDPTHPFTIVNGDIFYLDIIARMGKSWDLLGANSYRGQDFSNLWKRVKNELGLPVLFFEFGADAFNARENAEDQRSQAEYIKSQWQDIYNNTRGRGYGNALGGFVFEWRDEWWKTNQKINHDVQDLTASWQNKNYRFDYEPGKNNMNEEWFGIARLGEKNHEGVFVAEPRLAWDVMGEILKIDPYTTDKAEMNVRIDAINIDKLAAQARQRDQQRQTGEKSNALNPQDSVR